MTFTAEQINLAAHALGIDMIKACISDKRTNKILPKSFYRNRFQQTQHVIFDALCDFGFAKKSKFQELDFYEITEKGIKIFRSDYDELIKYTPAKDRNFKYVEHKINTYCFLCYYNFGPDNARHIFDYFVNYYTKGEYVSHTTKDVIKHFKTELGVLYKKGFLKQYEKK